MTTYYEEYEAELHRQEAAEAAGWQPRISQPQQTQIAAPVRSTFLAAWNDFFAKATDAPANYGEMAGLVCLSSVALGRCNIDRATAVRPNLFAMLSGPSSTARKSTVVQFAKDMVRTVESTLVGPRDYTMEGLLKYMDKPDPTEPGKKQTRLVLFAEEFGADLSKREAYNKSLDTDFCALYDGESFEKTRMKSKLLTIDKPRITLFAACAHNLLERFIKPNDWFSGFMMRFVFMEPMGERQRFVLPPIFPAHEWSTAVNALRHITSALIADRLSPVSSYKVSAGATYQYEQFTTQLQKEIEEGKLEIGETYLSRFTQNVLKFALLFQLDIATGTGEISTEAMQRAVHLAYYKCWPSFKTCVEVTTRRDPDSIKRRLLMAIEQPGGALKADLGRTFAYGRGVSHLLRELEQMQLVKVVPVENGHLRYFPFDANLENESV